MQPIVIVAKICIKEKFMSEVYTELLTLHKMTHEKDEGCIKYDLHKDNEKSNQYTFIEIWKNKEYLEKHEAKEHFLSFLSKTADKLDTVEISKLEKIEL